jgi:tetratricopeptide (TPR) repeat protein
MSFSRQHVMIPAACLLFFFGLAAVLAAQGDSRMTGQIKDDQGNPVAGLLVRLVPQDAGDQTYEVTSNKKGRVTFPAIHSATYSPEIESTEYALEGIAVSIRGPDGTQVAQFKEPDVQSKGVPNLTFPLASRVTIELTVKSRPQQPAEMSEGGGSLHGVQGASGELEILNALFDLGDWDELLKRSETHLAEQPDDGGAVYLRGIALWRTGRLEEAVAHLERAMVLVPDQPGIHGTTGVVLIDLGAELDGQGRKDEARETYSRAADELAVQIEATPDDMTHLVNYVITCEKAGRTDDAIAALRAILEIEPEHPQARKRLGELLIDVGRPEGAIEVLSELDGDPKATADRIYNAAVALWNDGKLDETIQAVEKAIELDPDNALFHRLLGRTLVQKGDNQAAIGALEKAVALAPDDPAAATDQQLIEALRKQVGD